MGILWDFLAGGLRKAAAVVAVPAPAGPPVAQSEADLLRSALDLADILDNETRAGVAAIAMGESGMRGYTETGYAFTRNARIREVFRSRVGGMTDAQIDTLKADDRRFFNHMYGAQFADIHRLGNIDANDGYAFRGRGFIQLTGRANYGKYGAMIGRRDDLLSNPDLANDPRISAQLTAVYIKDRYRGGGFPGLMACVGNNVPNIKAKKEAYFRQFLASGEFASGARR